MRLSGEAELLRWVYIIYVQLEMFRDVQSLLKDTYYMSFVVCGL